jgi:ABC-type nitrate/sulfonate/bicarbonate transport system substrate-binding protein
VALSDESGALIDIKSFLISQGYEVSLIIAQDNQSTISMISNAKRESLRTKHINIRYYWLKDRIDAKEIKVIYVPTNAMLADLLTKAVQGRLFRAFVGHVSGRCDIDPA